MAAAYLLHSISVQKICLQLALPVLSLYSVLGKRFHRPSSKPVTLNAAKGRKNRLQKNGEQLWVDE